MKHNLLLTSLITLMFGLLSWGNMNKPPNDVEEAYVTNGTAADTVEQKEFDWTPLLNALIWHESKGVATARHGQFVGVLQIHPTLVNGVNKILAARGDTLRFTLNDRLSPEKSKQMFVIIQQHYNPECDIDKAIRIWAAGPGYTIRGTQRAVNEIRAVMRKQAEKK